MPHLIHSFLKTARRSLSVVVKYAHAMRKKIRKIPLQTLAILGIAACFFIGGLVLIFATTIKTPDLGAFEGRRVAQSTKIYDRTGKILLYDLHQDKQRTEIPFDAISPYIKHATIAIEDAEFYQHGGIQPTAIIRAVLANLIPGGYTQGGSTITQQVVKNSILVKDKTLSRKIKEWFLAIKLEKKYSKDEILGFYLNESPYGGSLYGVEEAAQTFFGKSAHDVTAAEAAYIAALPQAPTRYSPYGNHRNELDARQKIVLDRMHKFNYLTDDEYTAAKAENVTFLPQRNTGINAPHFVFYVRDYLEKKYGDEALEEQGLRVTTTLDFPLQQKGEEIVKKFALENEKNFNASNAALTAVDPKTGQILVMVGSRDYFDEKIDGNFNVAVTGNRQPGSSFKPFVYATAFSKGYTPETVLFDVPTQFSTSCAPDDFSSGGDCYSPVNYDGIFRGPMSLRNALAQSINIPAVKLFYLAGQKDALKLAQNMGITTLGKSGQYGLTLVLGGGEVSLLDMTSAYGVFANEGVKNPPVGILRVEDANGKVLEEYKANSSQVLESRVAETISDILSDNVARAPAYGENSVLRFSGYDVAAKTGTTNEYRDAWIMGYTPMISVGAWAGNNDNSPMQKKVAGFIVAPLWNAFMQEALKTYGAEHFQKPLPVDNYASLKPVLRGFWQGGESVYIDKTTGAAATEFTPPELKEERIQPNVHSILYWVNRNDPLGPAPSSPGSDPQFSRWEYGVQAWKMQHGVTDTPINVPQSTDDIHKPENAPVLSLQSPTPGQAFKKDDMMTISVSSSGKFPLSKVDFAANGATLGSATKAPFIFTFTPEDFSLVGTVNISATGYDTQLNKSTINVTVSVQN